MPTTLKQSSLRHRRFCAQPTGGSTVMESLLMSSSMTLMKSLAENGRGCAALYRKLLWHLIPLAAVETFSSRPTDKCAPVPPAHIYSFILFTILSYPPALAKLSQSLSFSEWQIEFSDSLSRNPTSRSGKTGNSGWHRYVCVCECVCRSSSCVQVRSPRV